VVLAGGAGRRLGGRDKAAVEVRGEPMLARVLAAVAGARPRVVVGPPRHGLPPDVRSTVEQPPGGGPVAGLAAGLRLVDAELVAVLGTDLPGLTADAVESLCGAVATAGTTVDGTVYVDGAGRRQTMCGVWRTDALRRSLATLGEPAGRALRELLGPLRVTELTWTGAGIPPWFDCDTEDDLRRAEEYPR
jgi:molybdopterin-guanine dinucleotide biosynthesis protein A